MHMTVTLVRLGDHRFFIASRDVSLGCHLAHEPSGTDRRPVRFQAGHIPSWCRSCERYAPSPIAAGSRWLLLLLSAAGSVPHLRGLPGAVTAPCPAQAPPPNPIA